MGDVLVLPPLLLPPTPQTTPVLPLLLLTLPLPLLPKVT
jgi:hypothetical protein